MRYMATKRPSQEGKAELMEQLMLALRRSSAAGVLHGQTIARRAGINATDMECLDLIIMGGPATAGEIGRRTGLSSVAVALLSSSFGAGAAVATRFLITGADPLTLATVRFGGGVLCLLPLIVVLRPKWPTRADWPAVAGLGFLFYAVFFVFYNLALSYTTVGRGTLALSTLPLMTMLVGAALGVEPLTWRKSTRV